jgi:omega-amidase
MDLKITMIQTPLFWEDKKKNLEMLEEKINAAGKTDLIILPEMYSTGFTMNAKSLAETLSGSTIEWMSLLANKNKCVITGSIIIEENGKYYNRLIWMRPDGHDYYDKRHLFRLAKEEKTYTPGDKQMIMEINDWKILPLVCYDLRFPVWSRRTSTMDYDLLIYVANWPERRIHAWKQLLPARAIENQCYVAGVNRIGYDGNEVFHTGDSVILDYKGEKLSNTQPSEESTESIILHKKELQEFRQQFPFEWDADEFELK